MELRAYGVATKVFFPLIDKGATDFEASPVTIASGDCKVSQDGGSFANITSDSALFVHVAGGIYYCNLTATEMQGKEIIVKIVDQTVIKEWEDQCIIITTVNHASAEIPSLWSIMQSTAAAAITATSIASDAIANSKIADGAITAAKIASDAITAAKLHSDVTTELQSGLATSSALTSVAGDVTAIKAVTDVLPTAAEIAEAVLMRDVTAEGDEDTATAQTLVAVILKLTSRFAAATGVTYKGDGTTVFMTQTPTTDAAADPVTELAVGAQ